MDDKTFAQLRADYADKVRLIVELTAEADEMKRQINDEMDRRKDHPGADVRQFRPRGWDGPTDQGSC